MIETLMALKMNQKQKKNNNYSYVAVEGYAKVVEHRDEYDFTGPIHLYENAGFSKIIEQNGVGVMRKLLQTIEKMIITNQV